MRPAARATGDGAADCELRTAFFNEKPAPEWRNNVGSFLAFHMNFRQDRRENSCIPPAKFPPKAELGGGTICAGGAGLLGEN